MRTCKSQNAEVGAIYYVAHNYNLSQGYFTRSYIPVQTLLLHGGWVASNGKTSPTVGMSKGGSG